MKAMSIGRSFAKRCTSVTCSAFTGIEWGLPGRHAGELDAVLAHVLDVLGPRVDERHVVPRARHVPAGVAADRARSHHYDTFRQLASDQVKSFQREGRKGREGKPGKTKGNEALKQPRSDLIRENRVRARSAGRPVRWVFSFASFASFALRLCFTAVQAFSFSTIACVNAFVPALPPKSRVIARFSASTCDSAASMRSAASPSLM
jgi:hypothetical protein